MSAPYDNGYGLGYGFNYGYGFGASALLVQGTDFNCVDKSGKPLPICFGKGTENHQLLQTLQQQLNKFSAEARFTPLVVDGFIGDKTVAAVAAIARSGAAPLGAFTSKELVTANARTIIDFLAKSEADRRASNQPVSPPGTPVSPTQATAALPTKAAAEITAITTAPTAAAADAASAALPKKSNLAYYILGGIAAVLVVGGVGFVVYRRKAKRDVHA